MTEKDFYYRVLSSTEFINSEYERTIIPVRLKSPFQERDEYFDKECGSWLPMSDEKTFDGVLAEYAEPPLKPEPVNFSKENVEDMEMREIKMLLERRALLKRWQFDKRNYLDADGIKKDCVAVFFSTDFDSLSLSVKFLFFLHDKKNPETPQFSEREISFNLKNGTISFSNIEDWEKANEGDSTAATAMRLSKRQNVSAISFLVINMFLRKIEGGIPKSLLLLAREKLILLAEKYTGFSMQERRENFSEKAILPSIYRMTLLPFEPEL